MTYQEQFTRIFKAHLSKNGYTQIELAKELGYDRSTINKWITGTNQVPIEDLHRLCIIFKLDKMEVVEFFKLAGYTSYIDLLQSNSWSFFPPDSEHFANNQAEQNKLLAFQALLKLQEEEGEPEQAVAKKLVWQAAPPKGFSGNIYNYVRKYIEALPLEHQEKLDHARRRMTHFWYRASQLMDILDPTKIFTSVGPPEILRILEPLEAIQAESIDPNWQPRHWPPMKLYIVWCHQQGHIEEASQLRPEVPTRPELYITSKNDDEENRKPQISIGVTGVEPLSAIRNKEVLPVIAEINQGYPCFQLVIRNQEKLAAKFVKIHLEFESFQDESYRSVATSDIECLAAPVVVIPDENPFKWQNNKDFIFNGGANWVIYPNENAIFTFFLKTVVEGQPPLPYDYYFRCTVWADSFDSAVESKLIVRVAKKKD